MGLPLQQSYINNTYQLPTPQILHPPLLGTPQILHPYPAENVGVTPQILHPPPNMQHRSAPTTTIVTYLRVCVGSSVTANPTPMHYQRGVRGVPKKAFGQEPKPLPVGSDRWESYPTSRATVRLYCTVLLSHASFARCARHQLHPVLETRVRRTRPRTAQGFEMRLKVIVW